MSNTRRTTDAGKFRQERFASSSEFERGLMANLVAKRCALIEAPADRELIWFLQYLSHQPGGIKQVAADLVSKYPQCVATPAMRKIGFKPGQIYTANQVKIVRDEVEGREFPLRGELTIEAAGMTVFLDESSEQRAWAKSEAQYYPEKYSASDFVALCQEAAAGQLEKHLLSLCLDPAMPIADGSPWYFPALVSTLREYRAGWIAARKPAAVTSLGEQICSALDYASETGKMVLIDGAARTGKTFCAQAWCDQRPGAVRYVQVPATNDDYSFYRDIAASLGVSINSNLKANELRSRVEETLRAGRIMLVMDEAHYLWPQRFFGRSTPCRVNWLMTALVNYGVPVALITTPQFFRSQKEIESRSCWTSEQFTGRIGHYEKLPDTLSKQDLESVAAALVPGLDARAVELLVLYAQSSAKYLAGIRAAVDRAGFIARKQGRAGIQLADVKHAIKESAIPSDSALTAALQATHKQQRRRAVNVPAAAPEAPLPASFSRAERPLQAPDLLPSRADQRRSGVEQLVH